MLKEGTHTEKGQQSEEKTETGSSLAAHPEGPRLPEATEHMERSLPEAE